MSMRPADTVWFELLTTHDDLTDALEALAHTGRIELELHDHERIEMEVQDLQLRLQEYTTLERAYKGIWPQPDPGLSPFSGSPAGILDEALDALYDWEKQALPKIHQLELVNSRLGDRRLLLALLADDVAADLDYGLLSGPHAALSARLFLAPSGSHLHPLPAALLWKEYPTPGRDFLLLVGTIDDLDSLTAELALKKYIHVPMPPLPASGKGATRVVADEQARLARRATELRRGIDGLSAHYHVSQALGEIGRMTWFANSVATLPATHNFAWLTGWTSDTSGDVLRKALDLQGSRAILNFSRPPTGLQPPLMLHNPWWARPFEVFARLLGTPGRFEADPSRVLALLAPLLFGYMFGDVGQGLILLGAGIVLQKRWPLLRILVANGASAITFGFVFGSVFGREDLIPALWLHPIEQPLPVLVVPLVAGASIVLLGLTLNAVQAGWRGERLRWLQVDAPVIMLYLGVIFALVAPVSAAALIAAFALAWFTVGNLLLSGGSLRAAFAALGSLLETMLQLILNTLSFVRVGAFALAHAGLSLAFNIMADSTASVVAALLILVLGNALTILLEGLVVSVQTARLILFEFFIRFLRADGRTFKPLSGPSAATVR